MKLTIGNRNYSSWSLRGWLAAKQSGLPVEEEVVPLDFAGASHRAHPSLAPSHGKVPVLWDGDVVVWDSLAIIDTLADKVGRDRFWPKDAAARALARAMAAEMHAGFTALRTQCPMNIRARFPGYVLDEAARADVLRILSLWAEARARFGAGGPFLFGPFGAADIAFAPVVCRFITNDVALPGFAQANVQAVWEHEWMQAWVAAAMAEPWVIAQYEPGEPA